MSGALRPKACKSLMSSLGVIATSSWWRRPSSDGLMLSPLVPGFLLKRNPPRSSFECFEMLRILLIVFLMRRLGRIKFHRRQNFGHDRFIEFARSRELCFGSFGDLLFLIVAIKVAAR